MYFLFKLTLLAVKLLAERQSEGLLLDGRGHRNLKYTHHIVIINISSRVSL